MERIGEDGAVQRQRHYMHLRDGRCTRHWIYAAASRTPPADVRENGGVLLDPELLAGLGKVVEYEPVISTGWSGNVLERLVLADGGRLVAKRIVPGTNWIDRHTKDEGREGLCSSPACSNACPTPSTTPSSPRRWTARRGGS